MEKITKEENEKYFQLILKYKKYKREKDRQRVRNAFFWLISPYMKKWIRTILHRWGKSDIAFDKLEVISLSWECFEYCLDRYDPDKKAFIASFFYEYTRYYLLMKYAKKKSVLVSLDELKEVLRLDDSPENILFDKLLTLQQYRDVIPEEQLTTWDDAVMSIADSHKSHSPQTPRGMSTESYSRLKKAFINIVKLILK